jgi:hypothetical protein
MGVPMVKQSLKKQPTPRQMQHNNLTSPEQSIPPKYDGIIGMSMGFSAVELATPKGTKQSKSRNEKKRI